MSQNNPSKNTFVIVLIALLTFGSFVTQSKDNKLEFKHMGYDKRNVFYFKLSEYNEHDSLVAYDTIGLFCTPDKMEINGQFISSWRFLNLIKGKYITNRKFDFNGYSGIVVTDSLLFIHPDRVDKYTHFQFCPHPYFMNNTAIGEPIVWDLVIGNPMYNLPPYYNLDTNYNFHFCYVFSGLDSVSFKGCVTHKYIASSTSKFGVTTANYFLCNEYGLVRMEVYPLDKHKYIFEYYGKDADKKEKDYFNLNSSIDKVY